MVNHGLFLSMRKLCGSLYISQGDKSEFDQDIALVREVTSSSG